MQLKDSAGFFRYLKEREAIRGRKAADLPFPWTKDPILAEYKFTNVHREHDRTSNELIDHLYRPNRLADRMTILMNAATYRYFGTYEFAKAIGWQDFNSFDFSWIKEVARERAAMGDRVFTGAYVISNAGHVGSKIDVVCDHFLSPLRQFIENHEDWIKSCESWEDLSNKMKIVPGFGGSGFMRKETLIDTTYTAYWFDRRNDGSFPEDWHDFTPVGPGALRGTHRILFGYLGKLSNTRAMEVIRDLHVIGEIDWPELNLSLTDIQFGACEYDKYMRVKSNEGKPRSRYKRTL